MRMLSLFSVFVICFLLFGLFSVSHGQSNSSLISTKPNPIPEDILRVGFTIYGVDNETGNVVSFVNIDNLSSSRLFNATREDKDQDHIVEIVLSFPNQTIPNSTKFDACILVLKTHAFKCSQGYNSPSLRTEFTQFVLK